MSRTLLSEPLTTQTNEQARRKGETDVPEAESRTEWGDERGGDREAGLGCERAEGERGWKPGAGRKGGGEGGERGGGGGGHAAACWGIAARACAVGGLSYPGRRAECFEGGWIHPYAINTTSRVQLMTCLFLLLTFSAEKVEKSKV
jgi:hypothetical protein